MRPPVLIARRRCTLVIVQRMKASNSSWLLLRRIGGAAARSARGLLSWPMGATTSRMYRPSMLNQHISNTLPVAAASTSSATSAGSSGALATAVGGMKLASSNERGDWHQTSCPSHQLSSQTMQLQRKLQRPLHLTSDPPSLTFLRKADS